MIVIVESVASDWLNPSEVLATEYLIIIGVLASAQQIFMALSHTYASASSLAPIHYTTIPTGVFIGLLVFINNPRISLPKVPEFFASIVILFL